MNYKTELLAPAGSKDVLDAAIGEGADAVYLGLKDFNARARAKNFNYKEFEACVDKLHFAGKKVYVALNTVFEEWEKHKVFNLLKYLSLVKPDGVIVQDLGNIYLINNHFPSLRIHSSTQMNISTARGVNFLSKYGVKRAVLGRELSMEEIKSIRSGTGIELEIFVHGALCVSTSGLCLFSSYIDGKSGNRGYCSQPCRRLYHSDKKNGFFFSPNDLQLIDHIPELINAGVNSFKIEGRMKSSIYVGSVVRAYRYVIDNFENEKEDAVRKAKEMLVADMARKKTVFHIKDVTSLDFLSGNESAQTGLFLGKIIEKKKDNNKLVGLIKTNYELSEDDHLRIVSGNDKNKKNFKADILSRDGENVLLSIPEKFGVNDKLYLISSKQLKRKYHQIIPKSLNRYKRHPGNNKAPEIDRTHKGKISAKVFPEGFYVKIENITDYFTVQSLKPVMIILGLNKYNANKIINYDKKIPVKKENIIIELSPLFYNKDESIFEDEINKLLDNGYSNFIINNIGQINFFKNKNINIAAGQYFYTFNSYSIKFLKDNNIDFFVSPIENSKQNLFQETEIFNSSLWFVYIFSYPELFQITADLTAKYKFSRFSDSQENFYKINKSADFTSIVPEKPYSVIDRIDVLKKKGFNKYIIDFSNIKVTKNECKLVRDAIARNGVIAKSSRFNWKSGFFRKQEFNRKDKEED